MEQARELAQQFLAGHTEDVTTGNKQAPHSGGGGIMDLAGAAAKHYLAGQNQGGSAEGGAAERVEAVGTSDKQAPHAGQADEGLVDTLLGMYQSAEGKQFEGHEHEYGQLSTMAQEVLGTSIGRDVLKAWIKQRTGM